MFKNFFNKKKVLVTGNSGFKGSWLSVWLLKLGAQVHGVSNKIPSQPSMFLELGIANKIDYHEIDIRDLDKLGSVVSDVKPDIVFHLAAQPIVSLSYTEPIETLSTNIMGTAHVLECLRRANHPCCAVIITSDKCYDNVEWVWGYRESDRLGGKDVYSGSKGAAELIFKCYFHSLMRDSPVRMATARAGNVIGGGDWARDRIVPDCMRAWSKKEQVIIRNPNATRPWQHVLEPLSGYLSLAQGLYDHPELTNGDSFNFGPRGEYNHTVLQIISDMSKFWGFEEAESSFKITGNTSFAESGLLKLNCDKALHKLAWTPVLQYNEMIEAVSTWYFHYYRSKSSMYEFTEKQIDLYQSLAVNRGLEWTH